MICKNCKHELCYDNEQKVYYHNEENIQDLSCGVGFPKEMCGCQNPELKEAKK